MDKSLTLYPGVPSSIPGSPSLSDETLSGGPVFRYVLNQNHCRLSLRVLPNIKQQNHKYWLLPWNNHKTFFTAYEYLSHSPCTQGSRVRPGSTSLSNFLLNQNPCLLSRRVLLDIKLRNHKPTWLSTSYFQGTIAKIFLMSWRCVVDKSLALYPGVPSSIPGSTSLSDETLNL